MTMNSCMVFYLQGETLKIVMAPQRTRTTIGFEQRPSQGGLDGTLPRLTLFEHVSGARVLADLFPYYRLPNGKKAYYYYDAGMSPVLYFIYFTCLPWTALRLHWTGCSSCWDLRPVMPFVLASDQDSSMSCSPNPA